ncbi:hypothetical protein D3C79_832870 [compost metagenome]
MVRRADHVIPGVAGHQLRLQHFVAVVDVVGRLDPGFLVEVDQGVVGDVAVPVGNIDGFVGMSRGGKGRDQGHKGKRIDAHVESPSMGSAFVLVVKWVFSDFASGPDRFHAHTQHGTDIEQRLGR